jgi:hypothetical protein
MEDGMISGWTMLDALICRYETDRDEATGEFAREIVKGMLKCAFSARSEGFLPRSVSIADGLSHYPDSSRDQYTLFIFGMHRYINSELCTLSEFEQISRAAVGIARRAEKNVTKENGYDMLTDDGRPTLNNVMWGDTLGNHEYMRLPMIYLFAYEVTRDGHWLEKYREIRAEAFEKSLPMTDYWALYTLQQMQASVRICYDVETDEEWRGRYLELMNTVADFAEGLADKVRFEMEKSDNYNAHQVHFRRLKEAPAERFIRLGYKDAVALEREDAGEYFTLQDCAQISIISGLAPKRKVSKKAKELFFDAFEKIDLSLHERNLPLYFADGYYRGVI